MYVHSVSVPSPGQARLKGVFPARLEQAELTSKEGMSRAAGPANLKARRCRTICRSCQACGCDTSLGCCAARGQRWTKVPRMHTRTTRQQMLAPLISSGLGYDLERMDCVVTSSDERFGRAQREAPVERGQSRVHWLKRARGALQQKKRGAFTARRAPGRT